MNTSEEYGKLNIRKFLTNVGNVEINYFGLSFCLWRSPDLGMVSVVVVVLLLLLVGATFVLLDIYTIQENL